eukprot:5037956-Pyramimonas_sp.AAC.1
MHERVPQAGRGPARAPAASGGAGPATPCRDRLQLHLGGGLAEFHAPAALLHELHQHFRGAS